MSEQAVSPRRAGIEVQASWLPMIIVAVAQIQMAFNVTGLPVSMGAIVHEFDTSPTSVGTALVLYSLMVAGFVMLGGKVGKRVGSRRVFQVSVLGHGVAMAVVALSVNLAMLFVAQLAAGLAAAALVPALVVMIATQYRGKQQAQALGFLGAARAMASTLAFFVAGSLAATVGWRFSFGLLLAVSVIVFMLSWRLKSAPPQPSVAIDWVGAALAAAAITLISLGFNFINSWGLLVAGANAPFTILGMSPAPLLIVLGVVVAQAFFVRLRRRRAARKSQLLSLEVLDSSHERSATYVLLVIGALGPAVNFLLPLYIQIVQDRTSLQMAVAVMPYSLAILAGATLVVRLFDRTPPRRIGRAGFVVAATGLALLAFVIQNDWGTPLVILSLLIIGLGEGALLTLVFNVLVTSSPKELAGDVGALRGTVNNLSTGVGTAIVAALAIGVLGLLVTRSLIDHPTIPPALIQQTNVDKVDFVRNDDLVAALKKTTATPAQTAAVVRINEDTRLRALKISFLVLSGVALLAIIPAGGLPPYLPGEVPAGQRDERASLKETVIAAAES